MPILLFQTLETPRTGKAYALTTALDLIERQILQWEDKLSRPNITKGERNKAMRRLVELKVQRERYLEKGKPK